MPLLLLLSLSTCSSVRLSRASVYLHVCPCLFAPASVFYINAVCLSVLLFVLLLSLFVCLSDHLSLESVVHNLFNFFLSLSLYLSVCLSVCQMCPKFKSVLTLKLIFMSDCLSIPLPVRLSSSLYILFFPPFIPFFLPLSPHDSKLPHISIWSPNCYKGRAKIPVVDLPSQTHPLGCCSLMPNTFSVS